MSALTAQVAFPPARVAEGGSSSHVIEVRLVEEDGLPVVEVDGQLYLTPVQAIALASAIRAVAELRIPGPEGA